jgi:CHAT domain-containing protein
MRVWDKDSPDELPEILGVRHAVGRWMAGDSCELRQELHIRKIAVCATSYKDIPDIQPLPWAEEERKYLQDHFSTFDVKMVRAEVKSFLETGTAEVLHFSCHGDMSAQQPEDSSLELEDNKIKPGLIGRPETRIGIGKSKPLVFLNACQVGGAGRVLGLVFGWPQAFLNIGSTACIAPLWSVIDENARNIAEDFYKMTLIDSTPKSLGQALQSIRQQWRAKRSLTYLGYVLYGDPTARITR